MGDDVLTVVPGWSTTLEEATSFIDDSFDGGEELVRGEAELGGYDELGVFG